jgi:hypothetical protein
VALSVHPASAWGQAATNQADLIPSPSEWIPFSASVAIDNEARGMHLVGRHYRASDGSERWEQGRPDVDFISIRHIPSATYYEWRRGNGLRWRVHPMELPADGWRPVRFARGAAGITAVERTVEGLQLLQQIDASGREAWLAPALNFFAVEVTASPLLGTRQRYFNFDLSEPPAHLFVPPPDAELEHSDTPKGITTGG